MCMSGVNLLRWKFAEEANIILPSLEPGGWSAHGQPQDTLASMNVLYSRWRN